MNPIFISENLIEVDSIDDPVQHFTPKTSLVEQNTSSVAQDCHDLLDVIFQCNEGDETAYFVQKSIGNNCFNNSAECNKRMLSNAIHRSPSHRRLRVRTLDDAQQVGMTERSLRLTDSMLEDAQVADKLKRRLGSRREMGSCRRTIQDSSLSDFIKKSIMGGSLNAFSVVQPTHEQLNTSADLAMKVCLQGYFENITDDVVRSKVKQVFLESLIREEYHEGNYICRKNDVGDKLYIVEEGIVQFEVGNQVAGIAQNGSVFGELSLVYGIHRSADVKAMTPSVMLWSLDALSFRRIQSLIATHSLRTLTPINQGNPEHHTDIMQNYRRRYSSLSDLQEQSSSGLQGYVEFDDIQREAIIGRGTFGKVYLVSDSSDTVNKENGMNLYALKCMSKASIVQRRNTKRVLIEKNILQELESRFVISLLATYQDSRSIYFLTDFVPGGNLMNYMIQKNTLSHSECVFFIANLVSALAHIHKRGIVHRDIKPENCLIDRNGYLKLCDFGMAKRLPSTVNLENGGTEVVTLAFTICGTPEFMGPEFILSTGYDKNIDLWALGCMMVEMYTSRSPFEFGDLKRTFKEVCLIGMGKQVYKVPEVLQQEDMSATEIFIEGLLCPVHMRLGGKDTYDITRHEYFEKLNFEAIEEQTMPSPYIPTFSSPYDISHFEFNSEDFSEEDSAEDRFTNSLDNNEVDDASWCVDF